MAYCMNPMNFIYNLKYLGLGMLGIAAVIGLIILLTVLMLKIASVKGKTENRDDEMN